MPDADILREFIAEAQEHLATTEDDILAVEREGSDADVDTVNRLFRSLHTIKGGAGFLELTRVKELAHSLENIVGRIRDQGLVADSVISEALLRGVDKLRALIEAPDDDSIDIQEEMALAKAALDREPAGAPDSESVEPTASPQAHFDPSGYDLAAAAEQGCYLYEFSIDLVAECAGKSRTPAGLLEELKAACTVLDTSLDLSALEQIAPDAGGRQECFLLVSTVLDDFEIISAGLDVAAGNVRAFSPEEVARFASHTADKGSSDESTGGGEGAEQDSPPTAAPPKSAPARQTGRSPEQTIRISVELIDRLMNLASELVLVRNQNALAVTNRDLEQLTKTNQQLNVVTSELQSSIMQTRMRPVGTVFSRFNRVVRDLARRLGKEIDLRIAGADVELDKGIIESIADPLTHLVRNAVDHGIEDPESRRRAGKDVVGLVKLSAFHQAGQVKIQIVDDGKGIDPEGIKGAAIGKGVITSDQASVMPDQEAYSLIFEPGFSTAADITDVSGRGVGMDVVKSNLQQLGGTVDVDSSVGKGTTITIELPLTLAIIPALVVKVEDIWFAIPQLNIVEVVWLHGEEVYQGLKMVGDREVYWLRGKMLPLVRLSGLLDVQKTYRHPDRGDPQPDRRAQRGDRRREAQGDDGGRRGGTPERRMSIENSLYILVLRHGTERFGLIVDTVIDTEEIVVKSLHRHLQDCRAFAGTTVLGNGRIAMIIDVGGLSEIGDFQVPTLEGAENEIRSSSEDIQNLLLFDAGGEERFGLPLCLVRRVEEISVEEIQTVNEREYLNFRDGLIPLVRVEEALSPIEVRYPRDHLFVIVPKSERPVGIVIANIVDTITVLSAMDAATIRRPGIVGSQLIDGKIVQMMDPSELVARALPGWDLPADERQTCPRVLLVDDSAFYQALLGAYLRAHGMDVTIVENGREALEKLRAEAFDAVVSDLEMPVMDGFSLARKLRREDGGASLPLLAVSAADEHFMGPRALDSGFGGFSPKHDLEGMLRMLRELPGRETATG